MVKEKKGTRGQSTVQAPYEKGKRVNHTKDKFNDSSKKDLRTSHRVINRGVITLDKFHRDILKSVKDCEFEIERISGGCLTRLPGVFSADSKYFFCACSNTIKVYNVATGDVVKIISESPERNGHKDEITCIILNPADSSQLYSASLDGTVKKWDYINSDLLEAIFNS
ncbi:493_t:CDS:2 [Acaulospora morrowiae]|uniref:493_t:CDS:1 n=1 Tax=Acaulospora morrowiae TaxID=94023 RepID=A0A9N9HSB6_9GLOM|nr:493_t:CDS:2 [Acaulospora morrowiae]